MAELAIVGPQSRGERPEGLSVEHLRSIVQDAHLNFLIGAGTPSHFFGLLGDIENALTELAQSRSTDQEKAIARASIQAYFFDKVINPNLVLLNPNAPAKQVLRSYALLGQTLNRILLRRRSTLLSKQINIFTTNIDQVFEVAFERLGIELNDGFSGKIRPTFNLGSFGSLRYHSGVRYEHRSEIPTFDLYKLHGSVGWRINEDTTSTSDIAFDHSLSNITKASESLANVRSALIPIQGPNDINAQTLLAQASGRPMPSGLAAFTEAYERLVIVNPEKEKFATTVLTETYYELIRRFANELERENSALFVHGFSFRDEHLRKLIVRSARSNPTLQIIVFCYSPSDRNAYEDLIPELDVPNGNIMYAVPPTSDQDGKVFFDLDTVVERYFAPLIPEPQRRPDSQIELIFRTVDGEEQ